MKLQKKKFLSQTLGLVSFAIIGANLDATEWPQLQGDAGRSGNAPTE
ncbi:uncharacterized protein METZ01_LOCUS285294, partial [marine metagenome]